MSLSLSRHFLGENCTTATSVPSKQPGSTLLALGTWSEDDRADHVSLYSLALAPDQEPSVTRLAALNIDSRVVDICATSPEDNEQTLVAVTRPGGVHVLRLTLPDDWQGSLEATQVRGQGVHEGRLQPVVELGLTTIGAACVGLGATLVCAGWDGAVEEVDLARGASAGRRETGQRLSALAAHPAGTSYVTGDWGGALRVWDAHARGPATQTLPGPGPVVGAWVHPTQPHLVGVAHAGGAGVRVWDLRSARQALSAPESDALAGPLTCAVFLPGAAPALACGTAGGDVAILDAGCRALYREPTAEIAAITTADDALLAFTDQEGLLVLEHAL